MARTARRHDMGKIEALMHSRRFWLAVAGVAAVAFNETVGIPEENVLSIAAIVIAWILGDSVRKTS
jgi:hypothetical protein